MNLSHLKQKTEQNQTYNVDSDSQVSKDDVKSIKAMIFPKFIRELNAQQNFKRKRQLRKKQQSIHQHLKDIVFNQILQFSPASGLQKDQNLIQNRSNVSQRNSKDRDNKQFGKHSRNKSNSKKKLEIMKDGNRIIGEWRNQQLHGEVQIFYKNGFIFKGRYQHGIRIRGYFNFSNGYEYTGSFLGDKFRGYGQLKLPNGKIICGDWQQQLLEGKAQIRYPTGQVYYGQIRNFKKHGKGYLFFNDGRKYIGEFYEGHITGNGQYYENQKLMGKGYWLQGQMMYQQNELKQKTNAFVKCVLDDTMQKKYRKRGTKKGNVRFTDENKFMREKPLQCSIALVYKNKSQK